MTLPVPTDEQRLTARLRAEESSLHDALARLESRVRHFEDVERPAYSTWLRLALGPQVVERDELLAALRTQRALAQRLTMLVECDGLDPREALHVLTAAPPRGARARSSSSDAEETLARRRAKLAGKRARRKEAARAQRAAAQPASGPDSGSGAGAEQRARFVALYRGLARKLHPDSPTVLRSLAVERRGAIWAEVQAAYDAGSFDRMLAIAAWIESVRGAAEEGCTSLAADLDAASAGLLSLAERFARLRALRRSCSALQRRLTELEADPAWGFAESRGRARRKRERQARASLEDEIARTRRALQEVDDFFASIGRPRAKRSARRG